MIFVILLFIIIFYDFFPKKKKDLIGVIPCMLDYSYLGEFKNQL